LSFHCTTVYRHCQYASLKNFCVPTRFLKKLNCVLVRLSSQPARIFWCFISCFS
jgi:hypothetical protein